MGKEIEEMTEKKQPPNSREEHTFLHGVAGGRCSSATYLHKSIGDCTRRRKMRSEWSPTAEIRWCSYIDRLNAALSVDGIRVCAQII